MLDELACPARPRGSGTGAASGRAGHQGVSVFWSVVWCAGQLWAGVLVSCG